VSATDDLTAQAVANLVTQFSSALDFYRELVQNSIDAGSSTIEVWLDYTPDEAGSEGVIEIHVDDAGEGMTSQIIDDQLTTLFSSSKEGDLTKIGKFGIGFVSVFAIHPVGVLVQTGRDGEYWEVFFHEDRSFTKSSLATPIEGTQITLFVPGDRARYTELVARSRETLDHWCRHSEAEITFEDRASGSGELVTINKPFAVEGECATEVCFDDTTIVLAWSRQPSWGFYNKGLALALVQGESDLVRDRHRHVAFRIKSRYLEHTLSRETVMRDANYDKAMSLLDQAIVGPLRERLISDIQALVERAATQRWSARERLRYFVLMDFLAREGASAVIGNDERPLWLGLDGKGWSFAALYTLALADERIFVDDQATPLSDRLQAAGTPVLLIPAAGEPIPGVEPGSNPVARALQIAIAGRLLDRSRVAKLIDRFVKGDDRSAVARAGAMLMRPADVMVGVGEVEHDTPAARLAAAAEALLKSNRKFRVRQLVCADLHGNADALFTFGYAVEGVMPRTANDAGFCAVVNRDHPHFRALLALAEREPDMAAYCLARSVVLERDQGLELDAMLVEAAAI
jgi:hypothetical protein